MLLRSSSTPTLSSLLSERDHLLSKPFSLTALFNNSACRGLCLKAALPSMRRARSETDLQAFVETEDRNKEKKRPYPKLQSSFAKLSIIQEKEQFPDVRDVQPTEDLNMSGLAACSARIFEDGKHSAWATMGSSSVHCVHARPLVKLGPLYMASEVGVSSNAEGFVACLGGGGVRGCDGGSGNFGGSGGPTGSPYGDSDITDSYYQRLLQSDPQNPLVLGNYAQYLSEVKHDHKKSEEYYERAILACPNDGEVLSKYAKHVWDVHKDSERAGSYFDQAVKATPDDCYVLASHASFLWQSEDDDEDNNSALQTKYPPLHGTHAEPPPIMASA